MDEEKINELIQEKIDELKGDVSDFNNTLGKIEQNKIESVVLYLKQDFDLPNFGIKSFTLDNIDFLKFISNIHKRKKIFVRTDVGDFIIDSIIINQPSQWVYIVFKQESLNYHLFMGKEDDYILENLDKEIKEVYCVGDLHREKSYFKFVVKN